MPIKMEANPFRNMPDLPVMGQRVKLIRTTKGLAAYKGLPFKIVGTTYGRTKVDLERQHRFTNTKTGGLWPAQTIRIIVPFWCLTPAKNKTKGGRR